MERWAVDTTNRREVWNDVVNVVVIIVTEFRGGGSNVGSGSDNRVPPALLFGASDSILFELSDDGETIATGCQLGQHDRSFFDIAGWGGMRTEIQSLTMPLGIPIIYSNSEGSAGPC